MIPGDFFVNNCRISQIVISAAAPAVKSQWNLNSLSKKFSQIFSLFKW